MDRQATRQPGSHRSVDPELRPTNRRVESFSDGVFAIVITIMVLEIGIPDSLALGNDPAALRAFGAVFLTYALSFFVIANLWVSHHYLIFTLNRPTRTTIWFNNLLLFCISTIPLVTRFLGMYPTSSKAAAAYGLVGAASTAAFMLLRSRFPADAQRGPPRHPSSNPSAVGAVPVDLHCRDSAGLRECLARLGLLRDCPAHAGRAGDPGPDRQERLSRRPSRDGAFLSLTCAKEPCLTRRTRNGRYDHDPVRPDPA